MDRAAVDGLGLGVDEVPVVHFDAMTATHGVVFVLVDVLFDASQGQDVEFLQDWGWLLLAGKFAWRKSVSVILLGVVCLARDGEVWEDDM